MADIVIVDDEDALREPVAAYLADQGLAVADVASGAALDRLIARDGVPRLVILDVTMPSEDGFSILRRLREAVGDEIGVILLTARRDVIDRVVGLELGADDYVMKPFEPRELLARVRTVLRRLDAISAGREREPATPAPKPDDDPFWVSTSQGHISVPLSSIDWIEAARDYALLHTGARSHMIRVTMTDLEARLDSALMIRVHRSAFVRPAAVRAMSRSGGHVSVILMSGRTIRVGPAYVREVRARLSTAAPD